MSDSVDVESVAFHDLEEANVIFAELRVSQEAQLEKSLSWFLAICVALNGGALVTLFGAIDKIGLARWYYIPFIIGVISALLSSGLTIYFSQRSVEKLNVIRVRINAALKRKSANHDLIEHAIRDLYLPDFISYAPLILRLLSFAMFFIGVSYIGLTLPDLISPNERTCAILQKDMLSAKPRRADSRELFEALKCRPNGGGAVYALPSKGR